MSMAAAREHALWELLEDVHVAVLLFVLFCGGLRWRFLSWKVSYIFRWRSVYPRKLQHLLIVCQFVSHTLIHSPYVRTQYYSSAGSTLGR